MIQRIIAQTVPFFPKKIVWLFSKKYIAGENLEDALKTIGKLHKINITSTIDVLGESIASHEQALNCQLLYLQTIEEIRKAKLHSTFSLKPTMFGLLWDEDFCYTCIRKIVMTAQQSNFFVRIDMEDSQCTSKEILLYEKLYMEFPANVGIVFQACLKRTYSDLHYLKSFAKKENGLNVRLCKGIYRETPDIAFLKKQEIRDNFLQCLEFMLENKIFAAIATHDSYLISKSIQLLKLYDKTRADYEFQMLLGVRPKLRTHLVNEGHSMRVYVPYGIQWFQYSARRLQENPHMVWDILTGIFNTK